jgi:hypothetical protein
MAIFVFLTTVLVRQAWYETSMWMHSIAIGSYLDYPLWEIGLTALMPFAILMGSAMARFPRPIRSIQRVEGSQTRPR